MRRCVVVVMGALMGCSEPTGTPRDAGPDVERVEGPVPVSSKCTLELVGQGYLEASTLAGAQLAGPALVAVKDGFVIAHREQDSSGAAIKLKGWHLSSQGELVPRADFDLEGCAGQMLSSDNGVSAAFDGSGAGVVVTALPNCGSGAGASIAPFDGVGAFGNPVALRNPSFTELGLAPRGGAVARGAAEGDFELVYRVGPSPAEIQRVVLTTPAGGCAGGLPCSGTTFKNIPIEKPFGDVGAPFGLVAASQSIRAYAAPVGPETQVLVGASSNDSIDVADSFGVASADWATMTAWDDAVAIAVPTSGSLMLRSGRLKDGTLLAPKGTELNGKPTAGAALAALQPYLFVLAGLEDGELALTGTGMAAPPRSVMVSSQLLPWLGNFDGQHIALAAHGNRVAVAWLNRAVPASSGAKVGGWALLSCDG